ncbi:MAG: multidrug effflux MFS transporter [Actinobacteria bacterium]|nr:multidrug effflux MFS transporter [Actinomycetota bacterium]
MPRLRLLVLLAALTAFGPMSLDVYLPAFPDIAARFGTDTGSVLLTMSACLIGLGAGQVLWGPVSDRYGRKRPLVVGLIIFIIASLLIAVAPSLPAVVLLRLIQALGGSAGIVVARAVVRDLYSGVELARAMSAIVTVFALAPVVAPLIGSGILAVASWEWMFVFLALFGTACLVGVVRMRETLPAGRRTDHGFAGAMSQYATIIATRRFRYAAAVAALGSAALFTYISSSPAVFIDSYGVSTGGFALLFAGLSLCFALGAQVNMRLLKRYRVVTLLRASVSVQVVASTLVLIAAVVSVALPWLLIPMVLALMTVAGVNSNGIALALDPFPKGGASAAALVGGLQMTIGAVAAATFSALTLPPPLEMGLGMTTAGLISISLIGLSLRRTGSPRPL